MSATPTGPSDEPTDLSVGGGRDREERDRERQERERYYRYLFVTCSLCLNMLHFWSWTRRKRSESGWSILQQQSFAHPCLFQSIDGALQHWAGLTPARKKRGPGRTEEPLRLSPPHPAGLDQDRVGREKVFGSAFALSPVGSTEKSTQVNRDQNSVKNLLPEGVKGEKGSPGDALGDGEREPNKKECEPIVTTSPLPNLTLTAFKVSEFWRPSQLYQSKIHSLCGGASI